MKLSFSSKIFIFAGICILSYAISGCDFVEEKKSTGNLVVDLKGDWKFSLGDDSSWASAEFNDQGWEEIQVPSNWENEGYYGYNGFAWYRKTFELTEEALEANIYLSLGYVDDVDETYINGNLVGISGGFPPYFLSAYTAFRKYFIPQQVLRRGENTIAVRVYDIQLEGGIIGGPIEIYSFGKGNAPLVELIPDINLTGIWKFKTGDNSIWKNIEVNDSSWRGIFVPGFWEAQGCGGYDGFAWYRKSFVFPEEYSGIKMVLLLGKIDDIDQTFINGKLVGFIGNWNFESFPESFNQNNEWETVRAYIVPEEVLKPGEDNLISVRVYDGFVDGGIYDGPIGFITQEKYVEYWKIKKQN